MKRLIVVTVAFMFSAVAFSQPLSGKVILGGDISITIQKYKDKFDGSITSEDQITRFSLLPKAGYFLSDRMAIGIQTGISSEIIKQPDNNPDKRSTTSFEFRPFGRYYLTEGTGGLFAEAGIGISAGKTKTFYTENTSELNETDLFFEIGPGVYYYITPSIAMEAQIGLFGFRTNIAKSGSYKNINNQFNLGFFPSGVRFGVTFLL